MAMRIMCQTDYYSRTEMCKCSNTQMSIKKVIMIDDDLEHMEILSEIARRVLGIKTLETRNSDQLDFYDISVWYLKDALKEAFEAGRQSNEISQH